MESNKSLQSEIGLLPVVVVVGVNFLALQFHVCIMISQSEQKKLRLPERVCMGRWRRKSSFWQPDRAGGASKILANFFFSHSATAAAAAFSGSILFACLCVCVRARARCARSLRR